MNLVLDVLLGVFVAFCLGIVAFVALYPFPNSRPSMDMEELTRKVKMFLSAGVKDNGGRLFVELIEEDVLLSLVLRNDSPGFDELRQLDDFRKLNTSKTAAVIKRLGEIHDQYII